MKNLSKKLVPLVLMLLYPAFARAQSDIEIVDREFSVGFGIYPLTTAPDRSLTAPVYNIDYSKLIFDDLVVGGSFIMSGNQIWHWSRNDTQSHFAALTASLRYNYVCERYFKSYILINLGIAYGTFLDYQGLRRRAEFAWYLGGGYEYGDITAVFLECGIGTKGVLSVGVRYRF